MATHAPAPTATVVALPAVAAVPTPAVAYLALPNGKVFSYPDLTSRVFADSAGYIGAAGDDWLLFNDDDGVFRLSSPITGKTRLLPGLDGLRAHDEPVEIVNQPAPKTTWGRAEWMDNNEAMTVRKLVVCPDGFIAAIIGREHFGKLALCSLETFTWSVSGNDRWRWYDDLALYGGRLHAVTACGDLLAFDVGVDGGTGEPFVSRVERVVAGDSTWGSAKVRYLVPSSRRHGGSLSLLMVVRRQLSPCVVRFSVFRADLASSRWEEVSRLGRGEALFVGRMCSRAVRRDGDGDGAGALGHRIFFLPDDCVGMSFWDQRRMTSGDHAAVYDMVDGRVSRLIPYQRESPGPMSVTWLFPSPDHDGGGE